MRPIALSVIRGIILFGLVLFGIRMIIGVAVAIGELLPYRWPMIVFAICALFTSYILGREFE